MGIVLLSHDVALNLDAVAAVDFVPSEGQFAAAVKFRIATKEDGLVSEIYCGEPARKLYAILCEGSGPPSASAGSGSPPPEGSAPSTGSPGGANDNSGVVNLGNEGSSSSGTADFVRRKSWYLAQEPDGRRYFLAFVNARGSCSMRTYNAETGRWINKQYRSGNYAERFAHVLRKARELTLHRQPNLEMDCRASLPDWVLYELKGQLD